MLSLFLLSTGRFRHLCIVVQSTTTLQEDNKENLFVEAISVKTEPSEMLVKEHKGIWRVFLTIQYTISSTCFLPTFGIQQLQ